MQSVDDAAWAQVSATRMANSVTAVREDVVAPGDLAASVGVYPWSAQDVDGLLRAADTAMYQVKQDGGDRVAVCPELARPPAERPLRPP
jgi:GGDEF domain-containing protein